MSDQAAIEAGIEIDVAMGKVLSAIATHAHRRRRAMMAPARGRKGAENRVGSDQSAMPVTP